MTVKSFRAALEWTVGGSIDTCLLAAMTRMAPPDVRLGCRVIGAGDESCLLAEEQRALTTRDPNARRASGAARQIARALLADLGHSNVTIGRERSGQPVWPVGVVGSLAHDCKVAVAAVGSIAAVASLGIDVEPADPLPDNVSSLVITSRDVTGAANSRLAGRLVFAAKEAAYKAVYPLDRVILHYDDIEVDLNASSARTQTGHMLRLHWCLSPRIVVLAIHRGGIDRVLSRENEERGQAGNP